MAADDVNARLLALDPRRRVDRSSYTDPSMPEFPGATLTAHVATRSAQIGAVLGTFAWAPISWFRGGRKQPLFSAIMPRVAATWMLGGAVAGTGGLIALAIVNKSPNNVPWTVASVDDRAYRITKNPKVEKLNDYAFSGAVVSVMTGRILTGKGFFRHMGIGFAWATVANLFVYGALPEARRRWPEYRPQVAKLLKDAGIDLLPDVAPPAPPKKK